MDYTFLFQTWFICSINKVNQIKTTIQTDQPIASIRFDSAIGDPGRYVIKKDLSSHL